MNRDNPEELVTLNFRRLGSYCPVLLSFATLLLIGALALRPVAQLPDSSGHRLVSASFLPSESVSNRPISRLALDQLPISFEPNQGQTDSQVKFLARGAGYELFLTSSQAVLALSPGLAESGAAKSSATKRQSSVVTMQLAGANPAAAISGANALPGKSNYFIGNDPANWHRDVPQFARVRYRSVYPGIDLVFYGNQGQLEYDFEVAAGANPEEIAFEIQGSKKPELDSSGDLILTAG